MYRTILESVLGFKLKADKLEINPCIPKEWTDFSIIYRYKNTEYDIHVRNHSNAFANFPSAKKEIVKKITVDGAELPEPVISLVDDGKAHKVEVSL
jgi:cellobiose phosphorylase